MYNEIATKIFNRLAKDNLINTDEETRKEALKLISCILSNNLGLEDYIVENVEELENHSFINDTICYNGELLKVEDYYYNTSKDKFVVICKGKEYSIGNYLNLVVLTNEEKYTQIFDVRV